ncbi:hypothetical protein Emin_1210 [Elusimicrobium minutum Pei191]|uniref:Flp/Fap pilin component n=1 Tax=Elusimicrobium minutum (strain Pei191) TaxID=445932 RepID=B2KE14_ELUMP|nr:class III signal peptide-containing protein [Elusimicrobium minutum]ACC98760.1 hypothetical protein Emin_1210 [Elusimicrobium minutum Pei191]
MKYFVKMQIALAQLKSKKGQGTVEYLLMLGVIVGVALIAGAAVKAFMPELFDNIKTKILGGVGQM